MACRRARRSSARVAPPTGLRGHVRDAAAATPVLGARVDLVGTRFGAYSRENGEFSVGRVPPGRYDVRVLRLGFEPLVATIRYPEDLVEGLLTLELRRATVA